MEIMKMTVSTCCSTLLSPAILDMKMMKRFASRDAYKLITITSDSQPYVFFKKEEN